MLREILREQKQILRVAQNDNVVRDDGHRTFHPQQYAGGNATTAGFPPHSLPTTFCPNTQSPLV